MPNVHEGTKASWLLQAVKQIQGQTPESFTTQDLLCIAGHEVRVRYADPALAETLGRATRHLRIVEPGIPELTIDCWAGDGRASKPHINWPLVGTVHADDDTVALSWDAPDGPLFAYDRTHRRAWARFDSLSGASAREPAAPFRRILNWWAADHGFQWLHAAAVGRAAGGLLLVGQGGSGKSTTALACLEAGLVFVGDDACLLEPGLPPSIHGLYASGKGDARTASLLPTFREEFTQTPLTVDDDSIIFADRVRPDGISTGFPLLGVIIPRITTGSNSRLSPVSPAAALRALAPSSLLKMPGNPAEGLQRLAATVRHLPAWELTLGPNPANAADLIKELIDGQVGR